MLSIWQKERIKSNVSDFVHNSLTPYYFSSLNKFSQIKGWIFCCCCFISDVSLYNSHKYGLSKKHGCQSQWMSKSAAGLNNFFSTHQPRLFNTQQVLWWRVQMKLCILGISNYSRQALGYICSTCWMNMLEATVSILIKKQALFKERQKQTHTEATCILHH